MRHDVTVQGTRFAVYPQGSDAQVIRLDRLTRTARADMSERMARAAEIASDCSAIADSLTPAGGPNSAVATVGLRCR